MFVGVLVYFKYIFKSVYFFCNNPVFSIICQNLYNTKER
jgi:hypothetical protein